MKGNTVSRNLRNIRFYINMLTTTRHCFFKLFLFKKAKPDIGSHISYIFKAYVYLIRNSHYLGYVVCLMLITYSYVACTVMLSLRLWQRQSLKAVSRITVIVTSANRDVPDTSIGVSTHYLGQPSHLSTMLIICEIHYYCNIITHRATAFSWYYNNFLLEFCYTDHLLKLIFHKIYDKWHMFRQPFWSTVWQTFQCNLDTFTVHWSIQYHVICLRSNHKSTV